MEYKFQISDIRLNEAHFSIMRDFQWKKNKPIEIKHTVEVGYETKDKVLQVMLSVSSVAEEQPFRFSVSWEGFFDFEALPSKEDLARVVHINCASIIFPFARETIADLTRRASIPPFHLPPFNFLAMYEEKQKNEADTRSRKPRKGSKAKKKR